jgi:hypothetical protein
MKRINIVVSLVSMLALTSARQEPSVCALLTAADIEAVTGTKASAPVPGGNAQMHTCMWSVAANKGGMTLSTALLPPGTSAVALAKKNAGVDALKSAKYTTVEKEYDNAYCSVMSPPASAKDGVFLTSCTAGAKGKVFSLAYISPTQKLALDQTKALLDKAIGRQR